MKGNFHVQFLESTSVGSLRRARIFVANYAARPSAAGIP